MPSNFINDYVGVINKILSNEKPEGEMSELLFTIPKKGSIVYVYCS